MLKEKLEKIFNNEDSFKIIWKRIYNTYPHIIGYIDLNQFVNKLLEALPELDNNLEVNEYDVVDLVESLSAYMMKIIRIYNDILENNKIGEYSS